MTQLDVLLLTEDPNFVQVVDALAESTTRTLHVVRVHDGEQAMASLDEGFVPSLSLLDLERPGVPAVIRRLRSDSRCQCTAVVVAGAGSASMEARRAWLPGEVWIPEPVGADDLGMAISLALSRADVLASGAAVPHAA